MVLHILVPPEVRWHATNKAPAAARRRLFTNELRRQRRKDRGLRWSAKPPRLALLAHWLPVARRSAPPPLEPLIATPRADACARTVLRQCEALLRQLLRRRRRALGLSRGELRRLADGFDIGSLRAAPECSAPALAFVLASMYWCGCCHPRSLFIAPLHPPTGLVRWLARFCVQEQVDQGQQVFERLVLEVQRIDHFANALVPRIQAMTARHRRGAVLLPDLLKIAESVDLHEGGSITTLTDGKSMTYVHGHHRKAPPSGQRCTITTF